MLERRIKACAEIIALGFRESHSPHRGADDRWMESSQVEDDDGDRHQQEVGEGNTPKNNSKTFYTVRYNLAGRIVKEQQQNN